MGNGNSAIIDVAIRINEKDIQNIVSRLDKSFQNMGDNTNISDNIKSEISLAEKEVDDLRKKLKTLSEQKLNASTFTEVKKGVLDSISNLEARTTKLESVLGELVGTLSSADGDALSKTLADLKSRMEQTANAATSLVGAVDAVSGAIGNGVTGRIIDQSAVREIKAVLSELQKLKNTSVDLEPQNLGGVDAAKDKIVELYNIYEKAFEKLRETQIDSPDYSEVIKAAQKAAKDLLNTWDVAFSQMGTELGNKRPSALGGYPLSNLMQSVREEIDDVVKEARDALNKVAKGTEINKTKRVTKKDDSTEGYTIPVELSEDAEGMSKKIKAILREVQKTVNANPVEIELVFLAPGQTKKANAALKKFQQQVDNLNDETTREQMQKVVDEVNKSFGKGVTATLQTSFDDVKTAINTTIKDIQDALDKHPIDVHPKIELEQADLNNFKDQVNDIAQQLEKSLSDAAQYGLFGKPTSPIEDVPSLIDEPKKKKSTKKKQPESTPQKQIGEIEKLSQELRGIAGSISDIPNNLDTLVTAMPSKLEAALGSIKDIKEGLREIGDVPIGQDNIKNLSEWLDNATKSLREFLQLLKNGEPTAIKDMIEGWRESADIMEKQYGEEHLREFSALINKGRIYGSYAYGKQGSTGNIYKTIEKVEKGNLSNAIGVHSHADQRSVLMSTSNYDKNQPTGHQYTGDLKAFLYQLDKGIVGQLTVARKQIEAFLSKPFYDKYQGKLDKDGQIIDFNSDDTLKKIDDTFQRLMKKPVASEARNFMLMSNAFGGGFIPHLKDYMDQKSIPLKEGMDDKKIQSIIDGLPAIAYESVGQYLERVIREIAAPSDLLDKTMDYVLWEGDVRRESIAKKFGLGDFAPDKPTFNSELKLFTKSTLLSQVMEEAFGIKDFGNFRKVYNSVDDFIKDNPLNLSGESLSDIFKNTGFGQLADLPSTLQALEKAASNLASISEKGINLGFDDSSSIVQEINKISSAIRELIDLYKQLNHVGEQSFDIGGLSTLLGKNYKTDKTFFKYFGGDYSKEEKQQIKNLLEKTKPENFSGSKDEYNQKWATDFIEAADKAGIALDQFKAKVDFGDVGNQLQKMTSLLEELAVVTKEVNHDPVTIDTKGFDDLSASINQAVGKLEELFGVYKQVDDLGTNGLSDAFEIDTSKLLDAITGIFNMKKGDPIKEKVASYFGEGADALNIYGYLYKLIGDAISSDAPFNLDQTFVSAFIDGAEEAGIALDAFKVKKEEALNVPPTSTGILSVFEQLSSILKENPFQKMGFGEEASKSISDISSSLSELIVMLREISGIGLPEFDIDYLESVLARYDKTRNIDVHGVMLSKYFGAEIRDAKDAWAIHKDLTDLKPKGAKKTDDDYYVRWAENIVNATNIAGISLDKFRNKQKSLLVDINEDQLGELSSVGDDQFDKITKNITTLKNSLNALRKELDLSPVTQSIQELKSTLLELSDVIQRTTGQFSASKLGEQFEEIKANAQQLKGVRLTKDKKDKIAKPILDQYVDYLNHGGTLNISDIGAPKNLEKYMKDNLGEAQSARAAEEEANALKKVEGAANVAATAKERFANANKQLFESVVTSLAGLDNEGKAFDNLNKLLNNLGGTRGDEKLQKLVKGLSEIQQLMSTELGSDSLIKSLENLSQSGDALKDLATVIKASKKQIEDAQNAVSPEATAAKSYLSDDIEAIKERGKAELEKKGELLGVTIQKDKQGLLEMIGLIHTASDDFQEVRMSSAKGDVWGVTKIEENTERIQKRVQKLEQVRRAWDRINYVPPNVTDEIMFDKDGVDVDTWEEMVGLAKEYADQIGNLQQIKRQTRQGSDGALLESFSFIGDKGHITMGRENDIVASSQTLENVLEIKAGYDALIKRSKEYYDLREKEANGSLTERERLELQGIVDEYNRLTDAVDHLNDTWGQNIAAKAQEDFLKGISDNYDKSLQKYEDQVRTAISNQGIQNARGGKIFTPEYQAELEQVESALMRIREIRDQNARGTDFWDVSEIASLQDFIDSTISKLKMPDSISTTADSFIQLFQNEKRYYELKSKVADDSATEREKLELAELDAMYQKLIKDVEELNKAHGKDNSGQEAQLDYLKNISAEYDKYVGKTIDKFSQRIGTAISSKEGKGLAYTSEYSAQLDGVKNKIEEINALRDKYANGDPWDAEDLKKVHRYLNDVEGVVSGLNNPKNILAKTSDVDVAITKLEKLRQDNHLSKDLGGQVTDLINRLMSLRKSEDDAIDGLSQMSKYEFTNVLGSIKSIESEMYRTGQAGKGFWQQVSKSIQSQSANFIAQYFSFQDFVRYGRELIQTVTTLDTSLKELQKLTGASDSVMAQSFQHASETAQQYGATINSVLDSTSDWRRLGYSLSESEDLAKVTTLYQNIANGIDQQNASEYMVSILQGFQIDASESLKVVDAINEVSQNFAIDQQGVGESLQRSAAAFNAAHTDLNKSIALVTASNEVLQDPAKSGTMWNTLAARIRGASTE